MPPWGAELLAMYDMCINDGSEYACAALAQQEEVTLAWLYP